LIKFAANARLRLYTCSMVRGALSRLHNPRGRVCACLSSCWCQRNRLGTALRWYIPARFHQLPDPYFPGHGGIKPAD
jgi:hypothetical protein